MDQPADQPDAEREHTARRLLSAVRRRAYLLLAAPIVFAAAIGAGFQWGAPDSDDFIRVLDAPVGSDGAPIADLAGFVTEVNSQGVIVRGSDSPVAVTFEPGAAVELLTPIEAAEIAIGDWVVVGGRDDNVNSYILEGIIVIPADAAITGDALTPLYAERSGR